MTRRYNRWSAAEDAELRRLVAEGRTKQDICRSIDGRHPETVRDRFSVLGLTPREMTAAERSEVARLRMSHLATPQNVVAEVRRLANERLLAEQIGRHVGKTKNAVIGLCRRNGIELWRDNGLGAGRPGRPKGSGKSSSQGKLPTCGPPPFGRSPPVMKPKAPCVKDGKKATPVVPAMPASIGRVSIAKAGLRDCRYIGERPAIVDADTPVFCGAQVGARADGTLASYCPTHLAACTARVQPRG